MRRQIPCVLCGMFLAVSAAMAAANAPSRFKTIIFGRHADTLADFESFARQS